MDRAHPLQTVRRDGRVVRLDDGFAWPNARDESGNLVRPPLRPGVLNNPWLIGGRVTKL